MEWKMMYDMCIYVSEYRKSRLDLRLWLFGLAKYTAALHILLNFGIPSSRDMYVHNVSLHLVDKPNFSCALCTTSKNSFLTSSQINAKATAFIVSTLRTTAHVYPSIE